MYNEIRNAIMSSPFYESIHSSARRAEEWLNVAERGGDAACAMPVDECLRSALWFLAGDIEARGNGNRQQIKAQLWDKYGVS